MLDSDVAMLYHYETKKLNQAVKRNIDRFPERFWVIFYIVWVYLHNIDIPLIYPTIQCSLFIKYIIALKFSIFLYPLALDLMLCIILFVPSNTALVSLFSK